MAALVAAAMPLGARRCAATSPKHRRGHKRRHHASRDPRHRHNASRCRRALPPLPATAPAARPARHGRCRAHRRRDCAESCAGAVELDKIPSNVQTGRSVRFRRHEGAGFVAVDGASAARSRTEQPDRQRVSARFQLSRLTSPRPVIGTPQGLAVYQNGVRINEVFGDVVNWDLIPQKRHQPADARSQQSGLRPQRDGGALAFEMKNGYTYHAVEGEVSGGSYGRAGASVQAGGEVGNLSGYITADAIDDAGWRNGLAVIVAPRLCRSRRARRSDRISRHLHGRKQQLRRRTRPLPCKCSRRIGRAPTRAANDAKSTRFPDRKRDLEAERHVDLSGHRLFSQFHAKPRRRQRQRTRRTRDVPTPPFSAFRISMAPCPTSPRRGAKQSQQAAHSAQASWARSTAPGRRPTVSAARCRRHRRKKCSVTGTISRSG